MCLRLNTSRCLTLGDVTTVNLTMLKGGVAYNVIPSEMDITFDLRIPPTVNLQVCDLELLSAHLGQSQLFLCLLLFHPIQNSPQVYVELQLVTGKFLLTYQEFEGQIKAWCKEAGEDVTYEFAQVSCPVHTNVLFL